MSVKIERSWTNRSGRYKYGTDKTGTLYCRDQLEQVNLVLVDSLHRVKNKFFYLFRNPKTGSLHRVQREGRLT